VFRVLPALRRLRGTRANPFGYTRMRRLERQFVAEYRDSVEDALRLLRPGTLDLVAGIAALPNVIRGYEHVKLRNVERYRGELEALPR
jgi:indolepyruvate ferredoxin oxidoreductase